MKACRRDSGTNIGLNASISIHHTWTHEDGNIIRRVRGGLEGEGEIYIYLYI